MKSIAVVDAGADGIVAALNTVANDDGHAVQYHAAASPDILLSQMDRAVPDLILIHHTWAGLAISDAVERIRNRSDSVRVVVFTGRALDLKEIIECVRLGVCDYWLKAGTQDMTAWSRQLAAYCDSDVYTLRVLGKPAGSVVSLLRKAEADASVVEQLGAQVELLQRKLKAASREEDQQLKRSVFRGLEFLVAIVVLGLVFAFLSARVAAWIAAAVIVSFLIFFLFLQGKIAEAVMKTRKGEVRVKK